MKTNELLATASYEGDFIKVKSYLERQINPNIKFRKETLLNWAAQESRYSICKLLISYGAKLELKNELGETPIFKAISYPRVLLLLIKNGSKVNIQRHDKQTPLHLACAFGNKNSVKILLDYGADSWIKDENNRTPMYWAGIHRHHEIKELIIKKRSENNNRKK